MKRTAATLVAAVALFGSLSGALSGCGSSSGPAAPPPPCTPAHDPLYPDTAAALTDTDANGTWCITKGQTLVVQLNVPPGESDTRWTNLGPSDVGILQPVSNGAVSLPRGVTATFLLAKKAGVVTITSSRSTGASWSATIVVKA
jgi:hypothetical protein